MKSSFPHSKCSIEESFNGHKQLHNYFRSNTCTTTSGQTNAQLLPVKQMHNYFRSNKCTTTSDQTIVKNSVSYWRITRNQNIKQYYYPTRTLL